MTHEHLSPVTARRVFLVLTATRWFPVGLVVGITTLLPVERGLTVGEVVTAFGLMGLVVLALELPTSGFADAFGRRPVLLAAGLVNLASALVIISAHSFWALTAGTLLMGVYRALDSGPLEAWFVDTVHRSEPGADVDAAMAAQGVVTGLGMAAGALLSGALVWWHPLPTGSALLLPFLLWAALGVLHLLAVIVLMREPATARGFGPALASLRRAPVVVRDGLGLLRSNAALRGIVVVTVFSALAMIVFETLHPLRLAQLVGSEERAGVLMGPVAAAGWASFAAGSALVGVLARRWGPARTAILAHVLVAAGALGMGLVQGAAGLVAAYLVTYGLFGGTSPVHQTLLHREATAANRATVLSIDSMAGFAAFGLGAPLLGVLADLVGLPAAMVAAGGASLLGAGFYTAARRAEVARGLAAIPATAGAVSAGRSG